MLSCSVLITATRPCKILLSFCFSSPLLIVSFPFFILTNYALKGHIISYYIMPFSTPCPCCNTPLSLWQCGVKKKYDCNSFRPGAGFSNKDWKQPRLASTWIRCFSANGYLLYIVKPWLAFNSGFALHLLCIADTWMIFIRLIFMRIISFVSTSCLCAQCPYLN